MRHKCDKCEKDYSSKGSLKRHIDSVHLGIKRYKCPVKMCTYVFDNSTGLKHHLDRHNGVKKFKCTFDKCTSSFISKAELKTHLNRHTGTKKFKCTFYNCESSFVTSTALQDHLYRHNGLKRFKCKWENCESAFVSKGNFLAHMKYHNDVRDFDCPNDKCDIRCISKGNLQQHLKNCTNGRSGSSGEVMIKETLESMGVEYIFDKSHYLLTQFSNTPLRFDFLLELKGQQVVIEYDGRDHYTIVNRGGKEQKYAREQFEKLRLYDKIKDEFCKHNNIPMLRIPYWEKSHIPEILDAWLVDYL